MNLDGCKLYYEDQELCRVYKGDNLIYDNTLNAVWFSFEGYDGHTSGDFEIRIPPELSTSQLSAIGVSRDGVSWEMTTNVNNEQVVIHYTVNDGERLYVIGVGSTLVANYSRYQGQLIGLKFWSDSRMIRFSVGGELSALLGSESLEGGAYARIFAECYGVVSARGLRFPKDYGERAFTQMFENAINLVDAPNSIGGNIQTECCREMFAACTSLQTPPTLPATALADGCYLLMFSNCTALRYTPELPARVLGEHCYTNMFSGCINLTAAPEILPALTITNGAYEGMFRDCTALMSAPELPAYSIYGTQAYKEMFYGCSSLNYIKVWVVNFNEIDDPDTANWVYGVSPVGDFWYCGGKMSTIGYDTCPPGWTQHYFEN